MPSYCVKGVMPMKLFGGSSKELLTKIVSMVSPREQSNTEGIGKSRGKKESIKAKEYQRKKQDALEGKDGNKQLGNRETESQGKWRSETGKKYSSDKGGKAGKSGSQDQSKLQASRAAGTGAAERSRGKKESIKTKENQKKKQDALEGKDGNKQSSSRETESQGKKHGESGKEETSDKGGKAGGSGPQGQSNLQSGQTTVQFSSGGGVGSFGSLLALFASSATLVRAEIGSISVLSHQAANLTLQNVLRTLNNQNGSLLGEEGKNIKYIGKTDEQIVENTGKSFNLEVGSGHTNNSNSFQDAFSTVLKGISIQATETPSNPPDITKPPLFSIPFVTNVYYEGFNTSNFFFKPGINFAFPNSSVSTTIAKGPHGENLGFILNNTNPKLIDSYLKDAGIAIPSHYIYEILSPITTTRGGGAASQPISQSFGLTVAKEGDLHALITAAPKIVTDRTFGLTLTPRGDLYANVLKPLSALVNIQTGVTDLTIRINVGPGSVLDQPNAANNTMLGSVSKSTVFRSLDANTIVGNAYSLVLDDAGNFSYSDGSGQLSSFTPPRNYALPSNTIFRHVGTSQETAPKEATYGNFASIADPNHPHSLIPSSISFVDGKTHNLKFGENVLDVFGTKYGEGDRLDVNLATSAPVPNTLTMGGNTLAGFGTSYGDLQTLAISGSTAGHSSNFPTTITFNGNILWVDKNVGSVLYPHLQNLLLSSKLTDNSNIKIIFKDSIIHGNLGTDNFYGDVENLGDLADPKQYTGFIKGVIVTEVNGHVVTTPPPHGTVPATNSITWGNNVYVGGEPGGTGHLKNKANTFHFTLLGTADLIPEPVMLGHPIITDFHPLVDTLDFQLTPALFRSLDTNHNKTITVDELNAGLTRYDSPNGPYFDQVSLIYNPLTYSRVGGATIDFKGGGSLSLIGNQTLKDFHNIPHLKVGVNLTYIPIEALPSDKIVTTPSTLAGLTATEPYIYSQGPSGSVHSYFNELDNFFANSFFAQYTVSGLTDPFTGLPIGGVKIDSSGLPIGGVNIDSYGTITVGTTVPYIIPLTITATTVNPQTHQVNTATSGPLLFGFLNAPTTVVPDGVSSHAPFGSSSNILIGGLNSIIVGGPNDNFMSQLQGTTDSGQIKNFGSNLIVDTADSTTAEAYGNFKAIKLSAQGVANAAGTIQNDAFNFKANAFYVNGTVFGTAASLEIEALGGNNSVLQVKNHSSVSLDATANFENNTITIGPQIIYGNGAGAHIDSTTGAITGGLIGSVRDITITATPGIPRTDIANNIQNGFDFSGRADSSSFKGSGLIDTSANIQHNTFNFGPTQITIRGDSSGQTSVIFGNVDTLTITAENIPLKVISPTLTNITQAKFEDNHFNFGDATLTGGVGNTIFFGHLASFGDAYDHSHYGGFAKGVTVTYNNAHLMIEDSKNNTIRWGNDTYTGGQGADTYNFTLVEDVNKFPIMQGFDTIRNFDISKDTIVFNVARNLFESLGMNTFDDQPTLAGKLENKGVSGGGLDSFVINFTGPAGSLVPYGQLSLLNVDTLGFFISGLASLNYFTEDFWNRDCIIIQTFGSQYVPPTFNPTAVNAFDPVFIKVDQPLAFGSFVSNVDISTLVWGVTADTVLPPEFSLTPDGTLHVFSTSEGKTPVDAFITVTFHDDVKPTNIITLPKIHLFALNADSQEAIRKSATQGSTATEIFETNEPGNKIVGGGADIIYDATHLTVPSTPLVYGSKLIYDISEGGHTIIGDVENLQFINAATTITTQPTVTNTHAISSLDGQTITFGANMFNINSGGTGIIYSNVKDLSLVANAGRDSQGNLADATINNNIFNFGPNTIYTVGSTAGGSATVYGNLGTLSLFITNPTLPGTVGDASIKENNFKFSANKLVGSSDTMTLNPGIGTLYIANTDTATHDPLTQNLTSISGNKFTFGNSVLTGGTGHTYFGADIVDLSNTDFATGTVTLINNNANSPVQVTDSQDNVITWGNNTYNILSNSLSNTLTFTLLSLGGKNAAMQGNATITGFRTSTDNLDLKLSPALFRNLNTDHDRDVDSSELANSHLINITHNSSTDTTLLFAPSIAAGLAAGSITFLNTYFTDYNNIHLTTELAYTPAPITVRPPFSNFTPLVILAGGGDQGNGIYGNVLDNYFDHLDIANSASTYNITLSVPQLVNSTTLYNPGSTSGVFDKYGTGNFSHMNTTNPTLNIINVAPNDVHNPGNTVNLNLVVGTFDGTMTSDPNTASGGTFTGSIFHPSYLQGKFANETLAGNAQEVLVNIIDKENDANEVDAGGNLIINTNSGNKAFGDYKDITFSVEANTALSNYYVSSGFNFGVNALYVNGTVVGIADKLLIDVKNTVNQVFSNNATITSTFGNDSIQSFYTFGAQKIVGNGTLVGDLNTFQIDVVGNTTSSISGSGNNVSVDVSANVLNNFFNFLPTEIIALGNGHSSIFSHINSLSLLTQQGTSVSVGALNQNLDASANIRDNQFIFQNSQAVGGAGGVDYYSDINDLSNTALWTSDSVAFSSNGSNIVTTDASNNRFQWGNNKLYLSTQAGSPDTIHLNALEDQNQGVGLTGNLDVYNFNLTDDTIHFNLSAALYKAINGGVDILNGRTTASSLDSYNLSHGGPVVTPGGSDTTIKFEHGTVILHDVSSTLTSLPHVEIGTTLAGNTNQVDTFAISLPSVFSNFQETDHITQFNPNQDILQILLPTDIYYQMNPFGLNSDLSTLRNALTSGTAAGNVSISQASIEYSSPDSTNTSTVDSILHFTTGGNSNGSVTLHNVDLLNLANLGNHLQIGSIQAGTAGEDTFYFNAPPSIATPPSASSNFSAFQQFDAVTGFDWGTDNLEIALPVNLFNAISSDGTKSSSEIADILANNSMPSLGDINVTRSNGSTTLEFVDSSNVTHGSITLSGVTLTSGADIDSFGSHLHFGSIQQGTSAAETFTFDHAANGNSADLLSFKEFDHLIDFNTGMDTLEIKISNALYTEISNANFPGIPPTNDQLVSALETGSANGTPLGTHINVTQTAAQYGSGVDSILQFVTGTTVSGTITLHNVSINTLSDLNTPSTNHLLITHT